MTSYDFAPCGQRARAIDRHMRKQLADSLQHIDHQIDGVLSYPRQAIAELIAGLADGQSFAPATFAIYAQLVCAIQQADYPRAEALLAELAGERPLPRRPEITTLGQQAARDDHFRRLLDTDPSARFAIGAPQPVAARSFTDRLQKALALMAAALPELAAEIDGLVSQIVLVAGDDKAQYQFDGGSSYMLWGGLFLNAGSHDSDVAMVEVLAHECAHLLLFGFACDEPLVLNGETERYPSPLRTDLRPMDGIYHSTYVSARMYWAMDRLLASGDLDSRGKTLAERARQADRDNFYAGYGVVAEFARLSDTGRAVMAQAKGYMDAQG